MAKKAKTPSFALEMPLVASPSGEAIAVARFEAARQIVNACLGESLKRLSLLRQSKGFQAARKMPKGKERIEAFKKIDETYGFREYDLHAYAKQFNHSWIGEHVDIMTIQALSTRVFKATQRYAFHKAGRPRFKKYGQVRSVHGKNNKSGIRWCGDHVEWSGLSLKAIIDPEDEVAAHGLKHRVKYVRIVRYNLSGKTRFFVQLVLEGKPFHKEKHKIGTATVGLDQGPSTIAIVSPEVGFAVKRQVCEELDGRQKDLRRLQRQLDRQRRANNSDNYNQNGTVKKGAKDWKISGRMKSVQEELAEEHRRQAAHRYSLQGKISNELLAIGNQLKIEKTSYRAWQKMFGRSVKHRAPGMLLNRILRKAESAGGGVEKVPTRTTRLSQVCHCGAEVRKALADRGHICPNCGIVCDRDLYSAFLASCVEGGKLDAGRAGRLWPGVDALLRAASSDWLCQQAKRKRMLTHGEEILRQSLSPAKVRMNAGKAHDDVVPLKGRERARAVGTPGTSRL